MPQKSKVYQVSDEKFIEIVKNAQSYSDCLRALGLNTTGGSSTDVLKRRISELELSVDHFKTYNGGAVSQGRPMSEILVKNSTYANISSLKKRLIKEQLLEYKCQICGNEGEWLGLPLSLQLDHINGDNKDHRLENLRFICPNCHSQTETYAGRNKKIG